MSILQANGAGLGGAGDPGGPLGDFYSHSIENSLRMSDASNSQIYWQAGTPSSGNIWTASFWFKKYSVGAGQAANEMFGAGSSGAAYMFWSWDSSEKFTFQSTADGNKGATTGSPQFRDVGAWYHMVIRADTTQGTQADRLRVYLNGEQLTTWGTDSIGTSTWDYINASGFNQYWGGASGIANGNPGCNHYLADINFCDGQSYDASYFGEFKNGIWVPIDPSVTYGNNGYRLEFKQTGTGGASSTTVGADTSGNNNHFTDSGISADDVVPDSPTSNWATMNPLYKGVGITYYEGNLKLSASSGFSTTAYGSQSTIAIPKDKKVYIEIEETVAIGNTWAAGIATASDKPNSTTVSGPSSITVYNRQVYVNGVENDYGASAGLGGLGSARLQAGDILGIAVDGSTGEVWFAQNNSWFKTPTTDDSGTVGDPSAGTNPIGTISNPNDEDLFLVVSGNGASNIWVNFGQDSTNVASAESDANGLGTFEYAPPTDYVCLAASSLSEPTIGPNSAEQADDYFNTVLYTGDSDNDVTVTSTFAADFVWLKKRSASDNHYLQDIVRGFGASKSLSSNTTGTEGFNGGAPASQNIVTTSSSLQLVSSDFAANSATYVAWTWKAGGTAVSNTDGSITSQVSAAPDAGFSIVSWTGNATNPSTIGHGLSSAPEMIILKNRDSTGDWYIGHDGIGWTDRLKFTTATTASSSTLWNNTAPTSSVFTISSALNFNGDATIAYCFHSSDVCKVGSYVGNGSTDGTFVYTGFRPAWIMVKATNLASQIWLVLDNKRDPDNVVRNDLNPNDSTVESSNDRVDFLSNGFKWRNTYQNQNNSGTNYIYLAFAEAPFKYANAR